MATVYHYRYYCATEQVYITSWGTEPPTQCPNDLSSITDITVVGTMAPNISTIDNPQLVVWDASPDAGWYQSSTIKVVIPAGNTGDITTHNWASPFDMYIWCASITQPPNSEGDIFTYAIAPDVTLGALTADALIGDYTINIGVGAGAFWYLTRGCEISITDGINVQYPGKLTNVAPSTGIVTFETPLAYNFATGSFMRFTNYPIRDHIIDYQGDRMMFAVKGLKSKLVPANYPMRIIYTNQSGLAKNLYFQMEYYMV